MAVEFSQRYLDIRKQVRACLRSTFGHQINIDDVTDAVMEKVFRRWGAIDEPVRWAITAAKHLAVDELRRATLESLSSVLTREVEGYGNTDQHLKLAAIMEALQRLPLSQQKIMTLLLLGYEEREIPNILPLSINSVYHYVSDARKRLEKILRYSQRQAKKNRTPTH
jgi:RNA polymerase sigma factor (sigma-70 family)